MLTIDFDELAEDVSSVLVNTTRDPWFAAKELGFQLYGNEMWELNTRLKQLLRGPAWSGEDKAHKWVYREESGDESVTDEELEVEWRIRNLRDDIEELEEEVHELEEELNSLRVEREKQSRRRKRGHQR